MKQIFVILKQYKRGNRKDAVSNLKIFSTLLRQNACKVIPIRTVRKKNINLLLIKKLEGKK